MQNTSGKRLGWKKHKLESRFPGEIITSETQMTTPLWQKVKNLLMKVKEESEKAGLKHSIHKTKIMASGPMANRWGNNGNSDRVYFSGLQNHCRW